LEFYKSPHGDENEKPLPPVEIPIEALSEEALRGIVDNFIMREGTDYGVNEVSYDTKFLQVCRQIKSQDIRIVFDPNSESVTLMTKLDWNRQRKANH
jgi:uncharacterized protein YheU (UPF0270 family)